MNGAYSSTTSSSEGLSFRSNPPDFSHLSLLMGIEAAKRSLREFQGKLEAFLLASTLFS